MKNMRRIAVCVIVAASVLAANAQSTSATLNLSFGHDLGPLEINRITLGQGGLSPDPMWHGRVAEVRALHPALIRLFVQQYYKLLPEKGHYNFKILDRSVDDIVRTGATPLMNIDFKPKLLFPVIDDRIVDPNSYPQWEALVSALVMHYKERGLTGLYWEVANEPDIGESGGTPYRFTADNYGNYYRHTVDAVLKADPTAHVGGPALANWKSPIFPALIAFCARNKVRLDFVSWHIYNSNPAAIEDTIHGVKALLAPYPSLHPETILDEWNMALTAPPTDPRIQPAFIAETAWRMKEAGLTYSCYYHIRDYRVDRNDFTPYFSPAGASSMALWWNRMPQYDGLFDFQNVIRPSYFGFLLLSRLTGDRLPADSSSPFVHAFLTYDKSYGIYSLLFWNYSADPVDVRIEAHDLPDTMYATRRTLDATAPSNDENARLRAIGNVTLTSGSTPIEVHLAPYAMEFWSIASKRH